MHRCITLANTFFPPTVHHCCSSLLFVLNMRRFITWFKISTWFPQVSAEHWSSIYKKFYWVLSTDGPSQAIEVIVKQKSHTIKIPHSPPWWCQVHWSIPHLVCICIRHGNVLALPVCLLSWQNIRSPVSLLPQHSVLSHFLIPCLRPCCPCSRNPSKHRKSL